MKRLREWEGVRGGTYTLAGFRPYFTDVWLTAGAVNTHDLVLELSFSLEHVEMKAE